jgi:hypothetical protein
MILTRENRNTRRETYPTDMGSNAASAVTGRRLKSEVHLSNIQNLSLYLTENSESRGHKTTS